MMARTQAADYEQRREAILAVAAKLFAEHGAQGASIADLATACQMSKSLIYHYYPSKEEILYAVMASHIDQLELNVAEALAENGSPDAKLRSIVHRFMKDYIGAADRQKVLLNGLDSLQQERREAIVSQQRQIVNVVTELLRNIDPSLAADPIKARAQAMLLFGMINWTHTWYDPDGALPVSAVADMALALILREQPTIGSSKRRSPALA